MLALILILPLFIDQPQTSAELIADKHILKAVLWQNWLPTVYMV